MPRWSPLTLWMPRPGHARPEKSILFVKFSAVDDYENFGQKRTLKKYGMDRNTLYLWRKQREYEEKGWASTDDFTCPMCVTPLLMGESWLLQGVQQGSQ